MPSPKFLALLCALGSTGVASAADEAVECPDSLLNNTGIGGGGTVTGFANVTDLAACCDLCHGQYHDECVGWVFGPTPGGDRRHRGGDNGDNTASSAPRYPPHNCAVMATNGRPAHVENHVSAIVKHSPAPAPATPPHQGNPCRADLDCSPADGATQLWRCDHAALPAASENNCHLPGPGTAGNSTCACAAPRCGSTPASPSNTSAARQYLMIGDSISLGMQSDLAALLSQPPLGWALTHNPGNAASANLGAHCVHDWVQAEARTWDVISFQHGLHDLGYDTERIGLDLYTELLTNVTVALAAVQAAHPATRLVWVKTTPVPTVPCYSVDGPCNDTSKCLNPPRYDTDVVLYNQAADAIMAASSANISTVDLYTPVVEKCGGRGYKTCNGFQLPMNVHYTAEGWTFLAQTMHDHLATLF